MICEKTSDDIASNLPSGTLYINYKNLKHKMYANVLKVRCSRKTVFPLYSSLK